MSEDKLSPKEAARKSMDQITGALVGIAMVLSAVFIPMAFFGGSVGVIYRQFSVTIVSAMVLSVVVAIVLTPALCATMLKPIGGDHVHSQHGFFGWFNRWFDSATLRYQSGVSYVIRRAGRFMLIYLVLIGGLVFMFKTLPTGFLPTKTRVCCSPRSSCLPARRRKKPPRCWSGSNATSSKRKRNPSTV